MQISTPLMNLKKRDSRVDRIILCLMDVKEWREIDIFSFAQMARWDTVYEKGGKKYQYYIDMNKDSLNEYDDTGGKEPVETSASVGTKLHLHS